VRPRVPAQRQVQREREVLRAGPERLPEAAPSPEFELAPGFLRWFAGQEGRPGEAPEATWARLRHLPQARETERTFFENWTNEGIQRRRER